MFFETFRFVLLPTRFLFGRGIAAAWGVRSLEPAEAAEAAQSERIEQLEERMKTQEAELVPPPSCLPGSSAIALPSPPVKAQTNEFLELNAHKHRRREC